jgi:hypothetical protein
VFVAVLSTLVVRLRRARGIERQQIKWPAFTVVVGPAFTVVVAAGGGVLEEIISEAVGLRWPEWAGYVVGTAALIGFPISIGIAMVRYGLYDIDILINRTLLYGALTATLVLIYFGGVATTQTIFRALTGQQEQPQLAIVISTLLIAALFNPLRRRIQRFIDRRFYRSKYDARKTLEAFSGKLRDETDLDALSDDLVGVVRETMQPAHVSLWLRPDTASKGKKVD